MIARTLTALAATGFLLTSAGCLVMTGSSEYETGVKVTETTLERLQKGETTEEWVRATLGEPSNVSEVEGQPNVKILRYDHTKRRSSGGTVFLLFAGGDEKETKSRVYVEITDGIVSDYWTE